MFRSSTVKFDLSAARCGATDTGILWCTWSRLVLPEYSQAVCSARYSSIAFLTSGSLRAFFVTNDGLRITNVANSKAITSCRSCSTLVNAGDRQAHNDEIDQQDNNNPLKKLLRSNWNRYVVSASDYLSRIKKRDTKSTYRIAVHREPGHNPNTLILAWKRKG